MIVTAVDVMPQTEPCPLLTAPRVEFVSKWDHGRQPEQVAHDVTGRDRRTGKLTLAVSVRRRTSGMMRFDGDLWRLPYDLHPRAILLLGAYWDLLNERTPKNMRARMERHFSRNTIIFDATKEQADDWREFLTELLSDPTSYVGIDSDPLRAGM